MTGGTPSETPGRVAVVIGAGPGVGAAVARRFAREGFAVGLVARRAESLAEQVAELLAGGAVRAEAAPADAADPDALRSALAALRIALGEPDVLVFNASVYVPGAPTESDYDAVLTGLRAGVLGALVAIQDVAPAMVAAGRGTVLITGGDLAMNPSTWSTGLSMQKAAVRSLAFTAAQELAPAGVHVTTVTIDGAVGKRPSLQPDAIAERYWEVYTQPREAWAPELVHR